MASEDKATMTVKDSAAPAEKQRSQRNDFWRNTFRIGFVAAAALGTAWYYIRHCAKKNFSALGHFDGLDKELRESLRKVSEQEMIDSIKSLSSDGEGGYVIGGAIDRLNSQYDVGVERVFAEHGASTITDKFNKVLTPEQKTRTGLFSGLAAAIAVGMLHKDRVPDKTAIESKTSDGKFADHIKEQGKNAPQLAKL